MSDAGKPSGASIVVGPPRGGRVHAGEVAALVVAAAVLVVRCVIDSRVRPLWCDEAYTAFAVSDPSFTHMLDALRDEINAMPPLSLVLGWGIARCLGVSEFALRIPSVAFAWVGIVLLWLCLRRSLNRWVAVWCAVCLPLANPHFLRHATEARCYSLYFAAFMAVLALFLQSAEEAPPTGRGAPREGWRVILAHGLLVAVHYVGGLLSALVVTTALVAGGLWRDDRLRRHALLGATGWLAVLPALPFYLAQRKLGGEFNWIPRPWLRVLGLELGPAVVSLALFAGAVVIRRQGAGANDGLGESRTVGRPSPAVERALGLLLVAASVFILALWVESRLAVNLFLDRYLFPLSAVWMVAIAFLADALVGRFWNTSPAPPRERAVAVSPAWFGKRGLVLVIAAVLASCAVVHALTPRRPGALIVEALAALRDHPGIPVLVSNTLTHSELGWYGRNGRRVVLLDDEHYEGHVIGRRIGAALGRHYLPGTMKSLPECAEAFDAFLVVNRVPHVKGVETFLAARPEWRATSLGTYTTLWDRRGQASGE